GEGVGRRIGDETTVAAPNLLDCNLARSVKGWCERGESNPHGRSDQCILSPARLPVSPLSHRCEFHAQQNTQEEPDAARRPPFCRFTTLSSLADRAEQSGPPRSSTVANPATGTHLEALPRCLAAGTITTSRPFRRVDHDAKQERMCARHRSD